MRLPAVIKDREIQTNFDFIGRKVKATQGPYSISSGTLGPGGAVVVTATHNANIAGGRYKVVAEQLDGGFGYYVNWIITSRNPNDMGVAFANLSGSTNAALVLNYYLIVD